MLEDQILSTAEAEQLYNEMDAAVATLNDAARFIPLEKPWMLPNAPELDAVSMADWLAASGMSRLAEAPGERSKNPPRPLPWNAKAISPFSAWSKPAVSIATGPKPNPPLRPRHAALANAFAAPSTKNFIFTPPVISIVVGDDQVMVTTADGRRFLAEDVILTAPPSTWKQIHYHAAVARFSKASTGPGGEISRRGETPLLDR